MNANAPSLASHGKSSRSVGARFQTLLNGLADTKVFLLYPSSYGDALRFVSLCA